MYYRSTHRKLDQERQIERWLARHQSTDPAGSIALVTSTNRLRRPLHRAAQARPFPHHSDVKLERRAKAYRATVPQQTLRAFLRV